MFDLNVGSMPVCGDDDRLAGIITDRDITVRATARRGDPTTATVKDAMTHGISYCFEDDDISKAAKVMEEKQIRRLVVLNRDKRMVGIVSLGDLAVKSGNKNLNSEALEGISYPASPRGDSCSGR
jgi:CBS domain-containing protein